MCGLLEVQGRLVFSEPPLSPFPPSHFPLKYLKRFWLSGSLLFTLPKSGGGQAPFGEETSQNCLIDILHAASGCSPSHTS